MSQELRNGITTDRVECLGIIPRERLKRRSTEQPLG